MQSSGAEDAKVTADQSYEDYSLPEGVAALLGDSVDPVQAGLKLRELSEASKERGTELLDSIETRSSQIVKSDPAILGGMLRLLHMTLLASGQESVRGVNPEKLRSIEEALPSNTPNRHLLQHLYAMIRTDLSLEMLVSSLHSHPPDQWIAAAQVLTPLMQHDDWPVDAVYPKILDCLQSPTLASPVLDVASFLCRKSRVSQHPAIDRLPMLNELLGAVSGRLSQFEVDPRVLGDDVETVQAKLGEAVALAVSLCDTLALIGDPSSIGKLNQTLELKHRRVQCEAAGALARLGDDLGQKRLIELTADPAARLRAISYADELGLGDLVDAEYRSDKATVEAEMSLWLSQPQQMGVPPTHVESVDSRHMLWPSFQDPIDVSLVRFEYNFGDRTFSNVGICGPVTFALSTDVADFPVEDIYAIYAGWHAEHPDIFSIAAGSFNDAQARMMAAFAKHLSQLGYDSIDAKLLGFFLDEHAGVFQAIRDETQCMVVTDGLETIDKPVFGRMRPPTAEDLFNLFKGRKMLRTFNPGS
ncbi:MAG: HEAT repeat domain-containing protein [Planctomycetota bacterium]